MPTQDLKFRLLGEDAGASRALSKVSKEAGGAHDAFGKLSGQLAGLGGPFGIAQEAFEGLAGGLDHVKEHGKSVGSVLTGIGVAATGAGVLLTQFGAKDQQAQAQLRQAVENTGNSWGDFKDKIEEAVHSQERFGHTADDTQNALNSLTLALGDPNKALAEMSVVADLAAKKHISLAAASDLLVKAQAGSTRAFKEFGIVLDGNGSKTDQINRALAQLQERLSGQASAAADTFSGRLQGMKAHAEDFLSSLAKFAPLLLAIGPVTTVAGAAMSYLAKSKAANVAADAALIPAETALAGAEIREAAAARTAAGARLGVGGLLGLGGVAAVAGVGAYFAHNYTTGQNAKSQAGLTALAASGPAGLAKVEQQRAALASHADKAGFGDVGKKLLDQYDAAIKAAKGGDEAAASITAIGQAAGKTTPLIDSDVAALHKWTDGALAASATGDAFQKSLNDLKDAADKNSKTLKGTSDAAITNRDALRNLASAELAHIDALKAQGADTVTVRNKSIEMSRQLETQATKIFGNKTQVDNLLRSLHLLPSQIKTEIQVDPADRAKHRLAVLQAQLDALTGTEHRVNVKINPTGRTHRVGFSHGGLVTGGTPGQDSVAAMLMPGEFVVRADRSNLGAINGTTAAVGGAGAVSLSDTTIAKLGRAVGVAARPHVTSPAQLDRHNGKKILGRS